jgi:pimeloyl-ACP methyl ester carboxylesterase
MSPPVYPDFVEPLLVKVVRIPALGELLVLLFAPLLFQIGIGRGITHKERLTPELLDAFSRGFRGAEGRAALLRILRWGRPRTVYADYPQIIRDISVPTLILQGKQDPYIPPSQAERLNQHIANAKLVFLPDGSHFLPIDTPQEIAREIGAFIQGT